MNPQEEMHHSITAWCIIGAELLSIHEHNIEFGDRAQLMIL